MSQSVRNVSKWCKTQVFSTFWPANVLRATAACNFLTSNLQKVVRTRQFFHILTYKYASRHSGVPILQITTSKMAPALRCFVHFHVQMSCKNHLWTTAPTMGWKQTRVICCGGWYSGRTPRNEEYQFSPARLVITYNPWLLGISSAKGGHL